MSLHPRRLFYSTTTKSSNCFYPQLLLVFSGAFDSMKRIAVVLLLALCMPFYAIYAQDCADRIQSAGKMYDKYKKTKDVKQLEAARQVLNNIINTPSNPEKCRTAAANMLKSFPQPATTGSSGGSGGGGKSKGSGVVSYDNNIKGSGYIFGAEVVFDAEGGICSDVQISRSDCISSVPIKDTSWLSVSEGTNYLVVRCAPNLTKEERVCKVGIICDNGTSTGLVTVKQLSGGGRSNSGSQSGQGIAVKITFESGKTTPVFENVGTIFKVLEENKNYSLQLEMPLCKNQSWFKNLFAPMVVNKRIKKITDYFVASGVDRSRITKNITLIEKGTAGVDCDCAYARIVE